MSCCTRHLAASTTRMSPLTSLATSSEAKVGRERERARGQATAGGGPPHSFPAHPLLPALGHPTGSNPALLFTFSSGPSVVCAGASPERGGSGLFALCTLDGESRGNPEQPWGDGWGWWALLRAPPSPSALPTGTLKLMEEADRLLWSVQVDHQLFALEKLDVTVSGQPGGDQPPYCHFTER